MDTRNKDRRSKNKRYKPRNLKVSPDPQGAIQGIIDVADSSDDQYTKSSLTNNWARYEEFSDDETVNEQQSAPDFQRLMQQPASVGGHFLFNSEKNWDTDDQIFEKSDANNYFNLNLSLLNAGIQTIPFYKRLDYDTSMFTKFEINKMNAEAEMAEKKFQEVIKEYEATLKTSSSVGSRKASGRASAAKQKANIPAAPAPEPVASNDKSEKDDELDELLSLTASKVADVNLEDKKDAGEVATTEIEAPNVKAEEEKKSGENKEDIQQWLDDILDE